MFSCLYSVVIYVLLNTVYAYTCRLLCLRNPWGLDTVKAQGFQWVTGGKNGGIFWITADNFYRLKFGYYSCHYTTVDQCV